MSKQMMHIAYYGLATEEGLGNMTHYMICKRVVSSFGCKMTLSSFILGDSVFLECDREWVGFYDGAKMETHFKAYTTFFCEMSM